MLTKGFMVKELKKNGIRKGEKDNVIVPLEHLKTYQVVELYYRHCKGE